MKGETEITVKIQDGTRTFPLTETYTFSRGNTFENIDDYVNVFKKVLFCVGYEEKAIEEVFGE